MAEQTREQELSRTFTTLADTLVADFDLADLLQTLVDTCVDVLDAGAAGLPLRAPSGALQVVAFSTEDVEFVELVQVGADTGPCPQCVPTGEPVVVADIDATGGKWPDFGEAALQRGFHSLQATPMRLRDEVIEAMNLSTPRPAHSTRRTSRSRKHWLTWPPSGSWPSAQPSSATS